MKNNQIYVGRHDAVYEYCLQQGYISENTPRLDRATIKDVRGKHVVGVLPIFMAAYAETYTKLELSTYLFFGKKATKRDLQSISVEDMHSVVRNAVVYQVTRVATLMKKE